MKQKGMRIDQEEPVLIDYTERAEFYDIESRHTDDHGFMSGLITSNVKRILEIPCGSGRNTFALADSTCQVTAVDIEPAMTKYLANRIEHLGTYDNITVRNADMRTLDLGETFDLIIVPREAFQLLTKKNDAMKALTVLGQHLNPQGTMMVDLATFHTGRMDEFHLHPVYYNPAVADGQLVTEWVRTSRSGKRIERSRIQNHITNSIIRIDFYYTITSANGAAKRLKARIELRRYSFMEFKNMAHQAGLKSSKVYRNYGGAPYVSDAVRMIFLLHPQP